MDSPAGSIRCTRLSGPGGLQVLTKPLPCIYNIYTYVCVGFASVGNNATKRANHFVSWKTRVPFLFCWRSPWLAVELDYLYEVENSNSAKGNGRIT